jgi:hypothetical protein
MAYTAWSVVYGEQPTAAKWNQLGANDAGFKDGTNIDNDAILKRHLANAAVGKAEMDYTSAEVYSSTEFDTGKKWIDGRAIYRICLTGNANVVVGAVNVNHGITGITSLEVVNISGSLRLSSTVRGASVNLFWHREAAGNWMNVVAVNNTQITFTSSFAWGSSAYTIIFEYVK